jgi:N-methylhydantoinase A
VQSNGGLVAPDVVKKSPALTVLSGPAAGPTAGIYYANILGRDSCITADMGGTSFDTSLVVKNKCLTSTEGNINRYRIALPSLDIVTIGAGGGSIGWINTGGLLQMGPQSAGANPGPICYDKGGELPTCTDANLILGYLNPDYFAGGKIKLNLEKTKVSIENGLAKKLNLSLLETAAGMYRIINSNMAQGVRQVSIEKGHDPREFLFIVAGGAGGIHACEICKELEIPMFIVPNTASIFCAAGMLLGDLKHEYIRSFITSFSDFKKNDLLTIYNMMKRNGTDTLISEGISLENIEFEPVLDLRYIGQYHEVQLSVDKESIESCNLTKIADEFHNEHNRLYGYALRNSAEIETINFRLRCIGKIERPRFLSDTIENIPIDKAFKHIRKAYIPETDKMEDVPVYNGDLKIGNNKISGPAIIEKADTSIFISTSYDCIVDKYCSFIVYDKKKI